MKRVKFTLLTAGIVLATTLTFSCSGDGGGNGNSGGAVSKAKIGGVSQKGPFIEGATVTLYELNDGLVQTGKSFEDRILDSKGSFEIRSVELASPYATLKASGNYRNEVTGRSSDRITLFAISDIREKDNVNINILTHLEYDRVFDLTEKGKSLKDAKNQAQSEILEVFDISGEFGNSEDMSIFGTSEGDAALLAISILLQGNLEESEFSSRLINFSQAIKTGNGVRNNEAVRTAMADWASEADLEGIRDNIFGWRLSSSVPPFEKYIRNFVSLNYGLGPCDASNEGVLKNNNNEASRNKNVVCRGGIWKADAGIVDPSSSSDAGTSSSSSVTISTLPIKDLAVYEFIAQGGGSFVDLDAGVVFRQSEAILNLNAGKIDIVYEGTHVENNQMKDGTYIYSAFGITEKKNTTGTGPAYPALKPLEGSSAFIISLEGHFAETVSEVLSNNADASTLASLKTSIYDVASENTVDKIEAEEGSVFAVVSSEGDIFIAKVSLNNGTASIKLTYLGM